MPRTTPLTPELYRYLLEVSGAEPEVLQELRAETTTLPAAQMQIGAEQGRFMRWVVELMGARCALEVGVFTGYSSICVALGLPADGRLVACDMSEPYTQVAARYWKRAGVEHKVDLRLGPALATLDALLAEEGEGGFDFAFIDADKEQYDAYYERALRLVRQGGVIAFDNVLWGGAVLDNESASPDTRALQALNLKLRDDPRVTITMVPIGDGLTLARRR